MIYLVTLSNVDSSTELMQMMLPKGTIVTAMARNNGCTRPAYIEHFRPTQDLLCVFGRQWAVVEYKASEQFKVEATLKAHGYGHHICPSLLALSEPEAAAVRALMESQDLSETAVFRQALRMYQAVRLGAAELTWKMNPINPNE